MLTATQVRTLQFIEDYFLTHQHAPKLLEVAHGIGISSKGTVSRYINSLIEAGYLAKAPHRHRGLQLANQTHSQIALIGKTSPNMQFKHYHSMRIKDESFKSQGFYPGDTLWYVPSNEAKENEVIVAYLDKTTPLIKRVQGFHGDFISLCSPHNDDKAKAYARERITIYGIIKGWLRNFEQN